MSAWTLAIAIFRFVVEWLLFGMLGACGRWKLVRGFVLGWFADYGRLFGSLFLTAFWGLMSTEGLCGVCGEVFRYT